MTLLDSHYFESVERYALSRHGVRDVELHYAGGSESLTRFANNAIHQNVSETSHAVTIRTVIGRRTASASTNRLDREAMERCVDAAVALTKAMSEDGTLLPMYEHTADTVYAEVDRYDRDTANCTPENRARAIAEAIRVVSQQGQIAAGILSTVSATELLLNSRGIRATHRETLATFSITAMAGDSSGWAKASAVSLASLDPTALANSASQKAARSAKPLRLDPGDFTVILEPSAVLDFVGQIVADFSATALDDQRSFLTERLGKPLFHPSISIADDVTHPLQSGAPFDGEGVPRTRVILTQDGVPASLVYARSSAAKAGVAPTGHGLELPNDTGEAPENVVIGGGASSLNEMIRTTQRGILVTRLWYIREVDPYEKIMTGMTRDGTFLVENGEIACGVRNFRFNQSVIEALANVEMLGQTARACGEEAFDMVVPAMKVNGFGFTEVTTF